MDLEKESKAASILWIVFMLFPFVILRANIPVAFGCYSYIYSFVFLFLEDFMNMSFDQILASIVLTALPILNILSMIDIFRNKGKRIGVILFFAAFCEMIFQLYIQYLDADSDLLSFASPFFLVLLVLWLISIRVRWRRSCGTGEAGGDSLSR